jgi:hypothetical protein
MEGLHYITRDFVGSKNYEPEVVFRNGNYTCLASDVNGHFDYEGDKVGSMSIELFNTLFPHVKMEQGDEKRIRITGIVL